MTRRCALLAAISLLIVTPVMAQRWATVWTRAAQGPYPSGMIATQPNLAASFPDPAASSHEQIFCLVVRPGLFDAVMDFDAMLDRQTGELRPEYRQPSTGLGTGDKNSLNRPGYLAMGDAVELRLLAPVIVKPRSKPRAVVRLEEPAATPSPGSSG